MKHNGLIQEDLMASRHAPVPLLEAVGLGSPVVKPVSFSLYPGECLVVKGKSGAGKTRLLRLIADLDEGCGDVFLDGVSRASFSAPVWRRSVIYQSAESAWWKPTVQEHIDRMHMDIALRIADRLALAADRFTADLSQLSTGERQRAALIRSLVAAPRVLLLDEPTSALDADNIRRAETLLAEKMQSGLAIVLVTHSEVQARRLGTQSLDVSRKE